MALWAGSNFNSNESAMVVNQVATVKSIPMVVKLNATLYEFLGKDDKQNPRVAGIKKSMKITGKNVEVRLMGKLATPTFISDGSSEIASATPTYTSDIFGAAEFALSHSYYLHAIPASELERYKGEEAKTRDYLGEIYDHIMYGYENTLGGSSHFQSTTAPSRTVFGGWQAAVDDSNTYGTIDRSDSANADFRGIVAATFGDTTLPKIQAQQNAARANNGNPSICPTGTTLFSKIQNLVQPYTIVQYNDTTAKFGAPNVEFAGLKFILDQRVTSGVIGLLDGDYWMLIQNTEPFTNSGVVHDFTKADTYVMHTKLWMQNICMKPNTNVKITGAT